MSGKEYTDVLQCGHCYNSATLLTRAVYEDIEFRDFAGDETIFYFVLQCPVCWGFTFLESRLEYTYKYDVSGAEYRTTKEFERVVFYPNAKGRLTGLPDAINKEYQAALRLQKFDPEACGVRVGRALEAVCKHEKVSGDNLAQQLSNLAKSGRMPDALSDIAHQLKFVRNSGAHVGDIEITEKEIPLVIELLEAILEYLYVAPAKVAELQAKLKKF